MTIRLVLIILLSGYQTFAQDLTSELEVWYKFDHTFGDTVVKDYSGNGRDLISTNNLDDNFSWGTSEIASGVDHFVHFPTGRDLSDILTSSEEKSWWGLLGSTPRTLAVWFKIDNGAAEYKGTHLYAYGNDNQPGGRYEVALKGHSIEFENAENTAANSWKNRNVAFFSDDQYPQNEWHHLTIVYDGNGDRETGLSLYVDGQRLNFNPVEGIQPDYSINTVKQYAPEIGRDMEKMSLADFRFYSRALTPSEVHSLADLGERPMTISTISTLIQDAVATNASEVVIPPGIYRGGSDFIVLDNVSDLKIVADDVTMICERRVRAFELIKCKNITISGLTIDYDPLPFTQGDIIAVGNDYVDVKIHKGYDIETYSRIDIIDKKTRFRKRGSVFQWESTAQVVDDGVVRVSNAKLPGVAEVGDMASMSGLIDQGAVHTFVVNDCKGGIVLKNLTINTGPGFGIFETEGEGGTILDGCKIIPGAKPEGATEERLLTTIWDAIQHKLTRRGPIVKNCIVKDAGDDSWSVTWDGDYEIVSVAGSQIIVDKTGVLQVGDSLRTSLSSEAVKIIDNSNGVLTLDRPSPWVMNTRIYSPDRRCEHFVFSDNYLHSSGRVLIKSGHGIIENNVFDNTHSGVTVNTEIGDGATGIDSIIIRDNNIIGTGHFMPGPWSSQAGAISIVDGSSNQIHPVGSFRNFVIENNTFTDVAGVNIVVTSASDVSIKENKFYQTGMATYNNTGEDYGIEQNTIVYTENCDSLTMDYNIVYQSGFNALQKQYNIENYIPLRGAIFEEGGDGIPDENDIDGDGIPDENDDCPNTVAGATVDINGCAVFTLPTDNFKIEAKGETCPDRKNGKIIITPTENHNYQLTINGVVKNFSTGITLGSLAPNNYNLCLSVEGEEFKQCFELVIPQGTIISGKSSVKNNRATVQIEKGTAPYKVFVNGEVLFETMSTSIDINVKHGDLLQIKTAVACEGVIAKKIELLEAVVAYPNPSNGHYEIALPVSEGQVKIEVYNILGKLLESNNYQIISGKVHLNLSDKPNGLYIAKIYLEEPTTLKLLKE